MTIEKAIQELKEDKALYESDITSAGDGTPDGDLLLALDMAISALEKQIPKQLEKTEEFYQCPACGENIPKGIYGTEFHSDFCPHCGAKMDGGDEGC